MRRFLFYGAVFAALLDMGTQVYGQAQPAAEPAATDLAKTTQNPVGDIVSVPFQFNFNGGAYGDQTFFNLNFQPVIPIHLNPKVTLISRTIVPIEGIPTGNGTSSSGVGDIQEQTFFTPARPHKIILGLGLSFSFPTATASPAKTGTWAGGFSGVVLAMPGPFVLGSLFQQLWPMSDSGGSPKTGIGDSTKHYGELGRDGWTAMDRSCRGRHQPDPCLKPAADDVGISVLLQRETTR